MYNIHRYKLIHTLLYIFSQYVKPIGNPQHPPQSKPTDKLKPAQNKANPLNIRHPLQARPPLLNKTEHKITR